MSQPEVYDCGFDGNDCPAESPPPIAGWACCLPRGHHGNHIGTTQDYGKLHQWAPEQWVNDGRALRGAS